MYEWNNYLHEINQLLYKQSEQIKALEEKVNQLEERIQVNSSPTIDKIEYHFDQLKIEHLEGTLHIGLSPNELTNIDDLGLPKLQKKQTQPQPNQNLIPILNKFVNEQGPEIIHNLSNKYDKPIDRKLEGDIIHDLLSQIPDRISFYEKEASEKHQITNQQQLETFIVDHIKKEIHHSLERFMEKSN